MEGQTALNMDQWGEPDGQIAAPRGIILLLLSSIGGINVVNGTFFHFYRLQGVLTYKDYGFGIILSSGIFAIVISFIMKVIIPSIVKIDVLVPTFIHSRSFVPFSAIVNNSV